MTVGVTKARLLGADSAMCASTGNTSASLAAYSARAGLKCFVMIPSGKIAAGKLAQAVCMVHRYSRLMATSTMRCASSLTQLGRRKPISPELGQPVQVEGQKTVVFEINDQLRRLPEVIVLPVGNAGNITAVWKGLLELKASGLANRLPRLIGIQAERASPIAKRSSLASITLNQLQTQRQSPRPSG